MTLSETISRMFGKNASSPAQRAVAGGAKDADSSPTDGQKRSGNYRKVHLRIDGLDISIENPKGSVRSGVSPDGKAWSNVLACDYGDIRGTESVDGDPVDVYLADHPENGAVFVIDQVDPKTGRFDEHKVMYGFDSVDDAKRTYLACYQNGWKGLGWITPVTKAEFMKWLSSSDRKTKPFHEYKSVIPIVDPIKVASVASIQPSAVDQQGRPTESYDGVPQGVRLRSFTDAPATRTAIMDNVLEAVKSRFPVEDDDVRLELADVKYEGPTSYTLEQQKAALLNNRRLGCGISGTWRLTDKRTGKVLDERRDGILRVPYYTDRGTIINNGSEYTVISQARLSPGVYVRRKQNGELESQFNVANGLGFRIGLNKETGALDMSVGQAHVPLYPILRAIGVKDDDIRKSWGDAVTTANVSRLDPRALDKVYARYAGRKADMNMPASEKAKFVSDALSGSWLDPDVVVRTLGIEGATGVTGNVILRAAQKLLNVNRGEEDPDERDNPRFSKFYGIEDMLRERIDKDSGRLTKSLLVRAKRDKSLARIGRNALSPYIDTFLSGSGLAMPGEEANPLSILTQMSRITRLGEGGISSPDLVTPEARNVQGDYLGYVDFISGPESFGIGIDVRAALGTMKGSDHRLYNRMVDMRTGKTRYVALDDAASHTVAFPGQDPRAPRLYAMRKGVPTMVPRDEVDFMVPGFGNTVSAGINMTPMPTAVQAGRQFYMSKFWEQYLPQKEGEVPLVDSLMDDGKTTYSEYYGRKVGCLTAPFSGTVVKANDKEIVVRGKDGRTHTASLVQGLPFNRMTQLSMFPQVKKGDEVQEGAILANSNFTDPKTGAMNMGRNLKVAVLPAPAGASSYEDAIVISEDAAKKLATSRLYGYEQDTKNGVQVARNKYLAAFPKAYTKKQADTIDDSGVVKVGTVLNRDDPMILAIGPKMLSAEDAQLGKLSSVLRNSLTDKSQKWEHDWPGVVTDVVAGPHGVKVLVKSEPPVKVGDKLCYDEETEVLTSRGWLHFRDVTLDDNVATLNPETFEFDYIKPSKVMAYDHDGSMYKIKSQLIDLLVTPNHNMFVKKRGRKTFELIPAESIVGKRVSYKKDAKWRGDDIRWFEFPAYSVCHRFGIITKPCVRIKMDVFMMLLGMYLSEGNSYDSGSKGCGIRISQVKASGVRECERALKDAGIKFTYHGHQFNLSGRWLFNYFSKFGRSYEKFIPDFVFGLSARQQNILFKWMMWGDGHNSNGRDVSYTTSSKRLADDFQRLCLHIGKSARIIHKEYPGSDHGEIDGRVITTKHDSYSVQIINSKLTPTVNHGHVKSQNIQQEGFVRYSGKVYCCTMPKWNVIFVRRNGNVCWCGNSPENGLKGVVGCYDDKTEVFTDHGWVPWPDVSGEYRFASIVDGKAGFRKASRILEYDYDGVMIQAHTEQLDYCVTPNHRMWCRVGNRKEYSIMDAESVFGKGVTHSCATEFDWERDIGDTFDLTDYVDYDPARERKKSKTKFRTSDFAELLGWYLSEGCVNFYEGRGIGSKCSCVRSYKVQISQSRDANPSKCRRIESLLDRMGLKWHYHNTAYYFSSKPFYMLFKPLGLSGDRRIPWYAFKFGKEDVRLMFEAMMLGDGTEIRLKTTRSSYSYKSKSRGLCEDVGVIATLLGYNAIVKVASHDRHETRYVTCLKALTELGQKTATFRSVKYSGKVYCASVPGGLLYVRRFGRPMWCGNSILPMDKMPRDAVTNEPYDMLMNPMGFLSRVAPGQVMLMNLAKVAKKTGKQIRIPQTPPPEGWLAWTERQLAENGVKETADVFDPQTGRVIKGVGDGYAYVKAFHHLAEKKFSARGVDGAYTQDEQPAKGGEDGAKRMCFTADQVIRVIHGEESIGHIVDKRIPEYVWTRFDDGSWGYSLVTNWFCRKGRMSEVLSISVDYLPGADSCSRKRVVYTDKVMHVTRQHHMYAFYKGEVLAGDLKPGDWLTTYGYVPTDDQMSLLFGSMLGDGCICNVNDNLRTSDMTGDVNVGSLPFYQEQHSHHQYAYVNWKVHCLGALVSSRKSTQRKSKHGFRRADGEDKHVVYFQIHRHDIAERLKDMFYRQKDGTLGRKNLDNVDLSRINDVGIAAWFLDDGCASEHKKNGVYTGSPFGSISTLGFTYDENRKLAYWLGERLGTQVSIKTTHNVYGGVKKEYYYLALSADACRSMARIVARYVRPEDIPASKRWLIKEVSKYPDLYVGVDTSYALGSVPALVTSVRPYSDGKHGPDDEICLYDITVAKSHKYCASDCLVSNSGFDSLALLSHGATDVIKDSVTLRGSYNDEYWRRFRLGLPVDEPGVPFIYKKFINTLKAGGVNVVEKGDVTSIMPQTDADIDALANGRVIESSQMVDSDMEPVKGGLFDLGKTGGMGGNRWSMIVLPEAVPNPMMEEPVRRVLGLTSKRLEAILSGKEELNGETGGNAIRKALAGVNVDEAMERARNDVKTRRGSQRDDAVKVLGYLKAAKRMGISPADWMITRVPVLPPMFRPVSKVGDVALVPDMNELYKDIIEMKGNYEALSRELPASALTGERLAVYGAVKAAYGLGDPVTQEGRAKNLKGAIRQVIGTVPKTGMLQAKVISKTQDLVGRSVITPNRDLDMDQIGLPEDMAWTMFRPFVERKLVQRGYAPTAVRDMIDEKNPTARHILEDVMAERPVLMDRAPTWHKFNIMAFKPHIVKGRSIHVCPLSCSAMNADFDGNCVDFDSILTVRLSKSTLHKIAKICYHEVSNKEKGYSMTAENTSIRIVGDDDIEMNVKIGMFPHMGEPRLDKNGAKVYKVPDGIRVLSVDPVTGARTFEPVTLFTHESGCGTVRVSYGSKSVIVSSNESLAVFDGASGRLVRVKPDESERRLTPVLVSSSDNFGSFGDRDLGWLFGSFISDGWISGNTVGYTKIEKAKRDEFVRILRDNHENFTVFEYSGKKGEGNKLGDSVKIHCNSRTLVDWMKQWKFVHEDSEAVPEKRTALFKMIDGGLIEGGSREFLWGMMSGLIDGDGSVVCNRVMNKPRYTFRINTSSKYLRDDVCRLCHKLGLRYSVSTVKARGWSNESYVVSPSTIDMASNLDMLTCIGETERGNIESMLASSLEFLDKSDMIPVSDSEYDSLRKMDGFKVGSPLYVTLMRTRKEGAMRGGRHHLIPFVDAMRKNESTSGLADRVSNSNTKWVPITSVEDAGSRDVFDLEVATTKTFVINDGVVVWDTVNIHVPASDKAAKQAMEKMLPSKNLFSLTDMKSVRYKPEKEQVSGLWALTRGKTKRPTRYFSSKSEAIAAYRNGEIGPNDPVEISGN